MRVQTKRPPQREVAGDGADAVVAVEPDLTATASVIRSADPVDAEAAEAALAALDSGPL